MAPCPAPDTEEGDLPRRDARTVMRPRLGQCQKPVAAAVLGWRLLRQSPMANPRIAAAGWLMLLLILCSVIAAARSGSSWAGRSRT